MKQQHIFTSKACRSAEGLAYAGLAEAAWAFSWGSSLAAAGQQHKYKRANKTQAASEGLGLAQEASHMTESQINARGSVCLL